MTTLKRNLFSWKEENHCLVIKDLNHINAASIPIQTPIMWRFMAKDWEVDRSHLHPMFRITIFNGQNMKTFMYEDTLAWALYYWVTEFAEKYSWGTFEITKDGCVLMEHEPDPVVLLPPLEVEHLYLKIDPTTVNSKLDAIKFIRLLFGPTIVGLKEAKDFLEAACASHTFIPSDWQKYTKKLGQGLEFWNSQFAKAPFQCCIIGDNEEPQPKIFLCFFNVDNRIKIIEFLHQLVPSVDIQDMEGFVSEACERKTLVPNSWYGGITPLDFFKTLKNCAVLNCEITQEGLL